MQGNTPNAGKAPRVDVYERVTSRIVADLESGTRPWLKPWSAPKGERLPLRPLRANGTPYRGINILLLWGAALDGEYRANVWMTYRQAAAYGAQVRKGERGALVVYADRFTKTETSTEGEDIEREIPFMKGYTVFNVERLPVPSSDGDRQSGTQDKPSGPGFEDNRSLNDLTRWAIGAIETILKKLTK